MMMLNKKSLTKTVIFLTCIWLLAACNNRNKNLNIASNEVFFEKIGESEEIKVSYDEDTMKVLNKSDKLIYTKSHVFVDMQQFSLSRRKFIFFEKFESEYPYRVYIYLFDGDKGCCRLLGKNWLTAMSDISMKYILLQNESSDLLNLSLYSIETGEKKLLKLQIDEPDVLKRDKYTLSIYRSENAKYDFVVRYYFDDFIAAEYGFNIKKLSFGKIFDATAYSQTEYLRAKEPSDYEIGW